MIRKTSLFTGVVLVCATIWSGAKSAAQTSDAPTKAERQLALIDIGFSGIGEFTRTVTGTTIPPASPNAGQTVSDETSSTLGGLITLRYVAKPYFGLEGNYTYARYTENYSTAPFGVQTQSDEYSVGYIATPPHPFYGFQPFASVGFGTNEFKPTPRGGEGLQTQARALYYYSVGVQQEYLSSHFGVRASLRQAFFLAPDYGQNYLTIKQHTFTTEPTVGFYIRF